MLSAKGRNIVGQQLPTLLDVTTCICLHCCAKFETGQTLSYVQTDPTTWSTMLRLFAQG